MKDKYLKEGLYYLYQHTKKCNAKAPLIEKKTTKKAKKKAKKKVKKKVKKVREIAVVFLTGYEPVQEDPEETKRIEKFIEGHKRPLPFLPNVLPLSPLFYPLFVDPYSMILYPYWSILLHPPIMVA